MIFGGAQRAGTSKLFGTEVPEASKAAFVPVFVPIGSPFSNKCENFEKYLRQRPGKFNRFDRVSFLQRIYIYLLRVNFATVTRWTRTTATPDIVIVRRVSFQRHTFPKCIFQHFVRGLEWISETTWPAFRRLRLDSTDSVCLEEQLWVGLVSSRLVSSRILWTGENPVMDCLRFNSCRVQIIGFLRRANIHS